MNAEEDANGIAGRFQAMAHQQIILRPDGPRGPAIEFLSPLRRLIPVTSLSCSFTVTKNETYWGRDTVESGSLERIAVRDSVVAASISQPGYGGSDGPPDWCDPTCPPSSSLLLKGSSMCSSWMC